MEQKKIHNNLRWSGPEGREKRRLESGKLNESEMRSLISSFRVWQRNSTSMQSVVSKLVEMNDAHKKSQCSHRKEHEPNVENDSNITKKLEIS